MLKMVKFCQNYFIISKSKVFLLASVRMWCWTLDYYCVFHMLPRGFPEIIWWKFCRGLHVLIYQPPSLLCPPLPTELQQRGCSQQSHMGQMKQSSCSSFIRAQLVSHTVILHLPLVQAVVFHVGLSDTGKITGNSNWIFNKSTILVQNKVFLAKSYTKSERKW